MHSSSGTESPGPPGCAGLTEGSSSAGGSVPDFGSRSTSPPQPIAPNTSIPTARFHMRSLVASRELREHWQIAITLGVVESVADDEDVLDGETEVVDGDGHPAARRLVQQGANPHAGGLSARQEPLDVGQRETRIHDVLDHEHVVSL